MKDVILNNIIKKYDDILAVKGVNLSIKSGSFFTFLGPSGCGKTTILRALAGFIKLDSGNIYLGKDDITNTAPEKRGIGMVFQNYALFPHMTVFENVSYGLKVKKTPKKEVILLVKEYLGLVGLEGYQERKISQLSGGEQQRVALARTLVTKPKVLLLDEPLSNLDAKLRIKMRNDLKNLQEKLGITTIFVTHDQEEALTLSHEIAIFSQGRCVQVGSPKEIYVNPINSFVASFIGETNIFKIDKITHHDIVKTETGLNISYSHAKGNNYISIRPECISIKKEKTSTPNEFEGLIEAIEFNGKFNKFKIRIDKTIIIVTKPYNLHQEDEFLIKEKIYVEFPKKMIKCFFE